MAKTEKPDWHATKARRVLAALQRIGWRVKRQKGSHKTLARAGWPNYVFAFHDKVEVSPVVLAKIGKKTGLRPEDL
jgi:predicted RNA binding protein YcfA (HicA-like mRNA interferase family)